MTRRPHLSLASILSLVLALGWLLAPAAGAALAQDEADAPRTPKPALDGNPELKADADKLGWIELSGPLHDGPATFSLSGAEGGPESLRGLIAKIKHVADDVRFRGLVIYLDQPALSKSQMWELEQAMRAMRVAGKRIIVMAESYDMDGYLLACSADVILLQRKGMIELTGLGVEEMYLAGLLEKVGVKADFIQVGRFKGAAEQLTNRQPSPEWDENFSNLLDDMYEQVLVKIARARNLDKEQVEKAMADSWTMSDEDYVKRGLIDRVVDRNPTAVIDELFGDNYEWDMALGEERAQLNMDNPFALFRMLLEPPAPQVTRQAVALIYANGAITSGASSSGGLFGGETIGSKTFIEAVKDARDNDLIKGVVIRVNSPGGSALASEVMWQAIMELRQHKPVYISLGPLAASGGYYLACAGEQIYATPNTIVGSIGVVGGKLVMGDLYETLGIGIKRRSRGPDGDMFNSVEPFTPEQREKVTKAFGRIYEQFTDRVMKGRAGRVHDIDKVAHGRLFTGQQGVANGLVDMLGGADAAVGDMAARTGLDPGSYDVVVLPRPPSFAEFLDQIFGMGIGASMHGRPQRLSADQMAILQAARATLGEQKWAAARDVLNGLMLLRNEPALLLMPGAVVVE